MGDWCKEWAVGFNQQLVLRDFAGEPLQIARVLEGDDTGNSVKQCITPPT